MTVVVRNGVSLAEQNVAVILHPLHPRNRGYERKRVCRREAEVCMCFCNEPHKEKFLCLLPLASCTASLTNRGPPPHSLEA